MFWGFKVLGFWSSHGLGRVLMFRVSGSGGEGAKEREKKHGNYYSRGGYIEATH